MGEKFRPRIIDISTFQNRNCKKTNYFLAILKILQKGLSLQKNTPKPKNIFGHFKRFDGQEYMKLNVRIIICHIWKNEKHLPSLFSRIIILYKILKYFSGIY